MISVTEAFLTDIKKGYDMSKVRRSFFFLRVMAFSIALIALMGPPSPAGDILKAEDVIAVVNGTHLTRGDFEREMNKIMMQIMQRGRSLEGIDGVQLETEVLESMINRELLIQESRTESDRVTETEVNERFDELKADYPGDEFKNALARSNMSEADVKSRIKEELVLKRYIDVEFARKVTVSDREMKDFYEQHRDLFKEPEQVRASHILIKVDEKATDQERTRAKQQLSEIEERLKKGEDFAAVAREFSQCPSKANGGDLGYFRRGQMVKPFEDSAFSLKPGQVSPIVTTEFGYHLIKVIDKKPARMVALGDIKDELKDFLKDRKVRENIALHVEKLKKDSRIERYLDTEAEQER
jgi:peptidyl-prolyl cis-trans isomerase C